MVNAGQNLTLNTGFGSLQMGPDGMIYASRYAQQHLYRIRNPNGIGAACQFDSTDKVSVAPNYTMQGLPHYLDALLIPPRYAGCAPLRVNFANPRPGGLWYEWRFVEDSTFSSSPTPVRTYTRGGQYGVVVRVGLPGGQVDSSFFTVMVYDPPSRLYRFKADTVCLGATSRFSLDTLGLQNLRFRVLLNGTPLPEDSAWFYHARLATAGTHTVRVIATNTFTQCQDTTDYPLVVRPKPTALFVLSDSVSCAPASLPIQAAGSDSAWVLSARLGRRALSLSANTWRDTLAYANSTHDTLRLVRTNSFGCSDTSAAKPYHVLPRPKASFSLSDTASCGFVYVRLLDSSRNVFNAYASGSLRWDFGDGSPPLLLTQSSGGAVFHAFQQSGVFDLRLIASNGRCSDTLLRPQAILITPAPQPGIGVLNQRVDSTSNNGRLEKSVKGCVPFILQLTDLSQGARDSVRFYHNNQPLSSLSLNFSSAGNHIITQRVYGSTGCITTDTLRITISPKPSLSSLFTDTLKSCGSVRLRLRAGFQQTDSVQLTWTLPGGTSTTTQQAVSSNWSNLSSTITQSGTVHWTMRLMATGCEDTASRSFSITIRPQTQAGLLPIDTLVCFGKQAQLQNTTTQADSLWLGTQAPGSQNYTFLPVNSMSFQPTLTTSGIWRFQLATSSVEGCRDTATTTLRVLTPLSFTFQYRDSAICGSVIRTLTLQSGDSLTLSEGGVPKGRFGPNIWRFELSGTDSLKLRVNMANARCDSTASLTIAYLVRPAASITFRTDSLRACLPFNSRHYIRVRHTDSLFWQTSGGWNAITPLPDSSQRPFNWSLPFTMPYSGPLKLRFTSVEGCSTDTLVGNLALKARPTLLASLSPSSGCKPLEAVLSIATTNADSLLIKSDSLNLIRLNPTTARFNLRFWANDRLTITATNGLCATDTNITIQINGFDNRPGLRLTATRADSVGGKEQIRLFWEALPMRKFYRIEVSADSVNWRFLTDQTDNSWTDPLSEVSKPWWYRVTAFDSCGNAAFAFQPMRHLALNTRWTSATQERIQLTSLGTELSAPIQLHRQLIGMLPLRQDSVLVSAPLNREEGADWQLGAEEMVQLNRVSYYLTQEEGGHWRRSNTRIDTLNSQLYLPTSFTPNGDGLNEVLRPIGIGLSDIRMEVWNRWGEKVYEGSGPNTGWNGQHQGQPAPQGHYLIRLQATTTTGQPLREEKTVWLGR